MSDQLEFFDVPLPALPDGMRYQPDLLSVEAEREILERIRVLPFRAFEFHGHVGNRRTLSFGWSYDFSREVLVPEAEPPDFLERVRAEVAAFAGIPAPSLVQVLISEYAAGAGIGWHRDKAVFGEVVGVSLLSACRFRLRRPQGDAWERATVALQRRSAYLLSGPARTAWEHSIPAVETARYSITFRTLRRVSAGRESLHDAW